MKRDESQIFLLEAASSYQRTQIHPFLLKALRLESYVNIHLTIRAKRLNTKSPLPLIEGGGMVGSATSMAKAASVVIAVLSGQFWYPVVLASGEVVYRAIKAKAG